MTAVVSIIGISAITLCVVSNRTTKSLHEQFSSISTELQTTKQALKENQTEMENTYNAQKQLGISASEKAALYASGLLMTDPQTWKTYESVGGRVSFQYPDGLFTPKKEQTDVGSNLRFTVQTQQEWYDYIDSLPFEGTCDKGDLACLKTLWEEELASYQKALSGQETNPYISYETQVVFQRPQQLSGRTFLTGVLDGVNGGCWMAYITYAQDMRVQFEANTCNDYDSLAEYLVDSHYATAKDANNPKVKAAWASDVLDGKTTEIVDFVNRHAILKVISTLKIK